MESQGRNAPWRGGLWLAIAVAAITFVYPLLLASRIPLLDPDEGLHAAIAQEMVQRGDWICPSLQGKAFLDKPILYFWAEAASLKLFGDCEAAVRLPGLMFGLLGMIATAVAARRMFGRTAGLVAAVFYGTMVLPVALAQAAAHDVALIPWITTAILLFWESERARSCRAAIAYAAAIGLLLGLSILTKGLVGVALVGITYGSYLVLGRRLTTAACLRGLVALLVAALVGSTWYVAMEFRSPGYLRYYFIERHLMGFATDTQLHGHQPWWFYLPLLLGGSLPWIAYLPVLIQDQWAKRNERAKDSGHWQSQWHTAENHGPGSPLLLVACWLVGCTFFLSLSHSKMVTYVWPVFPAAAILAAVAWTRLLDGTLGPAARQLLARTFWSSCLAGPLLLPVALLVVQRQFGVRLAGATWALAVAVSLLSWMPLGFWLMKGPRGALTAGVLVTVGQFVFLMTVVLPQVAGGLSARDLAAYFNRSGQLPARLLVAEERLGSLVFYLDGSLRAGLQDQQLQAITFHDMLNPRLAGSVAVVALAERQATRAAEHDVDLTGLPYEQAGHYRLYRPAVLMAVRISPAQWK
jgi:hypothetical protein